MLKLVIFDFDGVIIDSHSLMNSLFTKKVNKELGLHIKESDFAQFPGMRFEQRIQILSKQKGIQIPFEKIIEVIENGRFEYTTNTIDYVKLFPGVIDLFDELKKHNIKIALGSNGSRSTILKIMSKLKITPYFDNIVTYDDVSHGKPAPDMFLMSAEKLGVLPEECVVVEDATEGIEAAHAAGMKVVAVATTSPKELLKDADRILDSISVLTIQTLFDLDG